jgi:hypothetical protein
MLPSEQHGQLWSNCRWVVAAIILCTMQHACSVSVSADCSAWWRRVQWGQLLAALGQRACLCVCVCVCVCVCAVCVCVCVCFLCSSTARASHVNTHAQLLPWQLLMRAAGHTAQGCARRSPAVNFRLAGCNDQGAANDKQHVRALPLESAQQCMLG